MKYPMHRQCPEGVDSWCKFQRTRALDKPFKDKPTGLSQHIINIAKPLYMKLCDQQLLCKCLHGTTQNANESFNGMLWNEFFSRYEDLIQCDSALRQQICVTGREYKDDSESLIFEGSEILSSCGRWRCMGTGRTFLDDKG
ncbi:hypothetical protein AVEN_153378-1 [Araneus ventricosus]|uniref:Uncharacterized protein n=1 Tax=Araneus ventricosus TaxID=182803 RepID=A0A4Y2FT21_ARAVE|nr:hypothetical protein AVEN_153378-1 [Araneus ventricosus]